MTILLSNGSPLDTKEVFENYNKKSPIYYKISLIYENLLVYLRRRLWSLNSPGNPFQYGSAFTITNVNPYPPPPEPSGSGGPINPEDP